MSDEEKTEFQNDALDRYITRRLSEELSDIHAGEELIQRTLAAAGNQESSRTVAAEVQQSTPQRAEEHKVPKRRPWGRILAAAACAAVIVLGVRMMAPGSKSADREADGAGGMDVTDRNAQSRPQGVQNISAGDKFADVPSHENMADDAGADQEPEGYPGEGNLSGTSGAGEPMAGPWEGSLPGTSGAGEPMAGPDDGHPAEEPGPESPGGASDGEAAEREQRTEALMEELLALLRTAGGNSANAAGGYELTALTGWTDGTGMQARALERRWGETLLSCRIYENARVELCLTEQGETAWYMLEGWDGAGQLWNAGQ